MQTFKYRLCFDSGQHFEKKKKITFQSEKHLKQYLWERKSALIFMLQQELSYTCFLEALQMHTFKQTGDYFFIKIFVKKHTNKHV